MGCINQLFSSSGVPKREEAAKKLETWYPKTTIIGMFLDSHNLYAVVAFFGDTWKNLFLKFL